MRGGTQGLRKEDFNNKVGLLCKTNWNLFLGENPIRFDSLTPVKEA